MSRRALGVLLAAAALGAAAACGGSAAPARPGAGDVDALVRHIEGVHPDPWHAVGEATFRDEAARLRDAFGGLGPNERLVALMRLTALLGEGDGHTGIFPLDTGHRRTLRLYPVRLYAFADGLRVVSGIGAARALVGARLVAVAGTPADEVLERVGPLVPADNEHSRRARAPQWLLVTEVLHGLGLLDRAGPATFRFALPGGRVVDRQLVPVPARRWAEAAPDLFHPMVPQGLPRRPRPTFLARREEPGWAAVVDGGRAIHVALNATVGSTDALARRLRRLARDPRVRRVVLDLRHNPGGSNDVALPLLDALRSIGTRLPVVVLVSRTTFSAAAVTLGRLERTLDPVLVGEPSGGRPHLYGDPVGATLPATGWLVHVASISWEESPDGARDRRTAFEPAVAVPVRWADLAAGRDRALAAALRVAP